MSPTTSGLWRSPSSGQRNSTGSLRKSRALPRTLPPFAASRSRGFSPLAYADISLLLFGRALARKLATVRVEQVDLCLVVVVSGWAHVLVWADFGEGHVALPEVKNYLFVRVLTRPSSGPLPPCFARVRASLRV